MRFIVLIGGFGVSLCRVNRLEVHLVE